MSCYKAAEDAIFDHIHQTFFEGRPSFRRAKRNVFEITNSLKNRSKLSPKAQMFKTANEMVLRIAREYNGYVSGFVDQKNPQEPVHMTLFIDERYVKHVYDTQISGQYKQQELFSPSASQPVGSLSDFISQKEFANGRSEDILLSISPSEENNILSDSGNSTNDFLGEDENYPQDVVAGRLSYFLDHKKQLLEDYQRRLKAIEKDIAVKLAIPTTTPELAQQIKDQLKELNKERRRLTNEIEGVEALGKKGLKQEIYELSTQGNAMSVSQYVERDLERLRLLAESDDLENLEEAMRIIEFYELAGTFEKGTINPFFEEEQIFIFENGKPTPVYNIHEDDRAIFKEWKEVATGIKNTVIGKREAVLENIVNSNIAVKRTYGKDHKFTFDQLTDRETGRKDISWFDMLVMDATMSVGQSNGLLPQVALSEISQEATKEEATVRALNEKIDKINPTVLERLKKWGQTLAARGLNGVIGGDYGVFLERNKVNQLTGNYATKFNSDFYHAWKNHENEFWQDFQEAKTYGVPEVAKDAFKQAFAKRRAWRRNNTIIIQFHKVPEIINSPDGEFSEFSSHFNPQEADAYRQYLISVLGLKEYNKQVAAQKKKLREYVADKQNMLETLMELQGIDDPSELSEANTRELSAWIRTNSPFYGVNDYYETDFEGGSFSGNYQKYNSFIPRRYKATTSLVGDGASMAFTDTNELLPTNYYNKEFEDIVEQDDVLYEFHELIVESMNYVRSATPQELLEKLSPHNLHSIDKTSSEILLENFKWSRILFTIVPAFRVMWENVRMRFGVNKQSNISNAPIDLKTGKKKYTVNDSFLRDNKAPIFDKIKIEGIAFARAFNVGATTKITKLKTFTTRNITEFNTESLKMLVKYLGIDVPNADIEAGRLSAITAITGENVNIGKILKEYATHEIVKEKSFDLAKVLKYYNHLAGLHSARTNAIPRLQVIKNYYENINDVDTNKFTETLVSGRTPDQKVIFKGPRERAIRQFNNWWERVILGQVGDKHTKAIGSDNKYHKLSKTIYSRADKQKLRSIDALIKQIDEDIAATTDPEEITALQISRADLVDIAEGLGKVRTATAFVNSLFSWVRYLRLGWNLHSALTNSLEGFVSNMIISATGDYFDPEQIYFAYGVAKKSFVKNLTAGKFEMEDAKRLRMLMDKFNVLKDSKNELQEASVKTLSDRLEPLRAFTLNQRVEYINQGALLISVLRSTKIQGVDAQGQPVESNVWDAFEEGGTGKLKEEFRTEENIKNWEDITGDAGLFTKDKINQLIVLAHGNYDELRGMLAKSNTAGKALMMFKTWLPQQIFWRLGSRQDNILSGVKGFRGKYFSYGIGSGAVHGAVVGTAMLGLLGTVVGGIAGASAGAFFGTKVTRNLGLTSTSDSISLLKETVITTKVLVQKMIGMPVNAAIGRMLIDTTGKEFDAWVGKRNFTQQDANALKANMADIALQLLWIGMGLLVRKIFGADEDDDKKGLKASTYNYLINLSMQLSSQAAMYVNPVEGHNTAVGSIAPLAYLSDIWGFVSAIERYIHDEDIIQSGPYAGESRLKRASVKAFVPGSIKSAVPDKVPTSVGEGLQALMGEKGKRQFQSHRFDKYFKFDAKAERKKLRKKLSEDKNLKKKEIEKIVNKEIPTLEALRKKGMTREEYNKKLGKENKK